MTPIITLSDTATTQMRDLMQEQAQPDLAVRIFVRSANGNQVQYGMGFDNLVEDDDQIVEVGGIKFVVDAQSAPYVEGSEIDYVDALMGKGFTIKNANYVQGGGCGCGGNCGCGHAH